MVFFSLLGSWCLVRFKHGVKKWVVWASNQKHLHSIGTALWCSRYDSNKNVYT